MSAVYTALRRAGWHRTSTITHLSGDRSEQWTRDSVDIHVSHSRGRVDLRLHDLTDEQAVGALSGAGMLPLAGTPAVRRAVAALDAAGVRHPDEALTVLVVYLRNGGRLTDAEQAEVIGCYVDPLDEHDRAAAHIADIHCRQDECAVCHPAPLPDFVEDDLPEPAGGA